MKAAEMKTKSIDELKAIVAEQKKARFNMRFQAAAGEQVNAVGWRAARKDIARALTFINQKKKGA